MHAKSQISSGKEWNRDNRSTNFFINIHTALHFAQKLLVSNVVQAEQGVRGLPLYS